MQGADSTETDCPGSFCNLIVDVGVFEHRIGLVFKLLSHQAGIEILLVTEADLVASFIHMECAPFNCILVMQIPIITNNGARSSLISALFMKIHPGLGTSRGKSSLDSHGRDAS